MQDSFLYIEISLQFKWISIHSWDKYYQQVSGYVNPTPSLVEFPYILIWNILTHWGRDKNGCYFVGDSLKYIYIYISWMILFEFRMKFQWSFVSKGLINNIPNLVHIMAWRRPGDKPLSEPMVLWLPTHICVIWPQCVKRTVARIATQRETFSEWLPISQDWLGGPMLKLNRLLFEALVFHISATESTGYATLFSYQWR